MNTKNKQEAFSTSIKSRKHDFGFTLVELIVVIVILAILSTVAFVSFSSQSIYARDSARLSDLSSISKWLWLFSALSDKLPMPDSKADITASGTTVLYQWYAGSTVLSMIRLSDGWRDPLDKTTYYTYSASLKQNRFQIVWFLEDGNNAVLSYNPFSSTDVSADPVSYSGRFAFSKWDELWVLLDATTKLPIQSSQSSIDIVNTTWNYIAILDNRTRYTWTGLTIAQINPGSSCKRIKDIESASRDWTYMINPQWWTWFLAYCDMTSNWWGWTRISSVIANEAERLQWVASFNWSAACVECSWSWPKFTINLPEYFRSFVDFRLWRNFWYADVNVWSTTEYTWRALYVQMWNPTYWNIVRWENWTPRNCVTDYIYLR
ncbi:MAG: hypothetical protein ACD_2C00001G0001 [uncultured bacterium (gcode 4)]|uniref:Prepilin-type N-terminal cleavage/methylation domain-containing protein n=1 Tax=uncultured bacterium (gcode 4) TaxID=1234023 RepID=K2FGS2_9BACT|nr:MAG: hypothetical protein ACD_2C00001G0001 [uncultured bacterium (gcode 4)]